MAEVSDIKGVEYKSVDTKINVYVVQASTTSFSSKEQQEVTQPATFADLIAYSGRYDCLCMGIGIFTAIISGANQPAQLIVFGSILNAFNGSDSQDIGQKVSFLALVYFILGLQMWITNFIQTAAMSYSSGNQTKRIREVFFSSLLKQNIAFFDQNDQGLLATSVMETTSLIQEGLGEKMALGLQFLCAFIFGLIVAVYYVWQLALLICAAIPLMIGLIGMVTSVMSKSAEQSNAAYNEAGSTAQETLGAIRTLFSLNGEEKEIKKYGKQLVKAEKAGITQWFSSSLVIGVVSMVMWLMYALGLWFGAYLIAKDMDSRSECRYYLLPDNTLHQPDSTCITGGNIMICFFSILFGGLNLGQAFPSISAVNIARAQFGKILKIIRQESLIDPTSNTGKAFDHIDGDITFTDVQFAYPMRPDHSVYNSLNVTIKAGQTVAFVGPSGCGKSTAVALLERFYDPDQGAITLDGTDLRELRVSWLRSQIGLVSQEPVLFSGSIFDNISYGREGATREEVEAAAGMANAHAFIASFPEGYDTQVGERGIQLSGGQKQRIAIARAIIRDPKILILDEATSALDTASEGIVQAALDNLLRQKKRTTIIIAHRLSTIRNADRIFVFSKGAVVEDGTHDELVNKPDSLYSVLVKMQLHSTEDLGNANTPTTTPTVSLDEKKSTTDVSSISLICDVEKGQSIDLPLAPDTSLQAIPEAAVIEQSKEPLEESAFTWIWDMSAPERPYLYLGVVSSMAVGASFPLLGYFLSAIISVFFNPSTTDMMREANFWAYMFILLAGTQFVAGFGSKYSFGVITEKLATRVRLKTYSKMLHLDVSWYDKPENTAGSLSQQLASDCTQIKALTGERTSTSISQVVTLLASLGIAFWKSWIMTLVMLGLFPLIGAAFAVQASFVQKAAGSALTALNEAGAVVSSALLNIRTVAAFGLEIPSEKSFQEYLIAPMQQFLKKGFITGMAMGFGQFVILSGAGLAYFVGGELVKTGKSTFPEVLGVILCIMFGAVGIGQFSADASDKAEAMVSAKKISAVWATESTIQSCDERGLTPADEQVSGEISFTNLSFAYPMRPDHSVYSSLNVTIKAGQTVAFVGPSGCGKSTAVALLERFYDPDQGAITLDGTDLRELRVSWLRSQIGLVSQEPVLFSGSIFDNISYGREGATKEEVEAAAEMANAHAFIASFPEGYDTQVGERGIQLSGGQKQRIAIARAIIRDPKILILDEATSALDTASEGIVQAALDNLLRQKKRTTIIIAHRLSTIRNADRIFVFSNGQVIEEGSHDELIRNVGGHYFGLINSTATKPVII